MPVGVNCVPTRNFIITGYEKNNFHISYIFNDLGAAIAGGTAG
jgi:hypothetical protein